ncbi:alkaline phosphatase family protein [Haladaptatus halobius]|uniref:alkaline phosphatase family protein n=1 Tax=Haladaptatus halobius TaxID=2884875 RepID=UPI001D0A45E6|nr:alkaline phosphatase family protein [Haladaptatus halobius]
MTHVIACLDGLDPAYLSATETPGWEDVAARGNAGVCDGIVPSLTNVNNAGIVTADFPDRNGVTGNTYYDPERDEQAFMNDPSHLRCRTELQRRAERGETVAALVAKDKLVGMVGQGCDVAASAENPPEWLAAAVGEPPGIYSGKASAWLLEAAVHLLDERDLDVLYVSTTDVVPHKHGPDEAAAEQWVGELDAGVATLHERSDALVATADHGMNRKSVCVDLEAVLDREGHDAEVVRLITDEHTYHHQNLGGAAYVYLRDDSADALEWLDDVDGVDEVVSADEAARRFRLPTDDIGDALVLGTESSVFGPVENGVRGSVDLRSHGSHHERRVPYVASTGATLEYNVEAFPSLEG